MADNDQVVGIDVMNHIEQLGKAFLELEALKDTAEDDVQWSEIEEYFRHLETTMKKKFEELEHREKEFKEKESETCTLLAEREAAVASKEQDLLDRIQELKDAAVAAIAEALANHQPEPELIDDVDVKETKVSEENSPTKEQGVPGEVKPRPELMQFCEQMDAKGLLNYTMENQKNISAMRAELSVALESATEPARLVLASLEGFYPPDNTTQEGDKKDAALRGMRRSCLVFMEAMANLLARADHLLNLEIKQQAKAIADEWKPKLAGAGINTANANSLEAEAFLQLLATFRIVSEFDEEELCELVLAVSHQRRAPELCRSLGLAHKMPGIVGALVSSGRQIDAVHLVHAFELTETFAPVPLLKTYLKDLRRKSQGKPGSSGSASVTRNDANAQELAAVKAVVRCIKEYKLEADYPLDPLQRRVTQLEKSRPDKKRTGEFDKHQQQKKSRANGGFNAFRVPVTAVAPPVPAPTPAPVREPAPASVPVIGGGRPGTSVYGERIVYAGISERYPHAVLSAYDYQTPSQSAYAPPQAYEQRSYYYPPDDRAVTAPTYSAAPSTYGSYVGSGLQSSHQPYM